jgi:hypothetical protein
MNDLPFQTHNEDSNTQQRTAVKYNILYLQRFPINAEFGFDSGYFCPIPKFGLERVYNLNNSIMF